MGVEVEVKGDYKKTKKYLKGVSVFSPVPILEKYGELGVTALVEATPVRSGKTASMWSYRIESSDSGSTITWTNSHINKGVNIAVILQYGHGTGTGGYVEGTDYINPAIIPIFEQIAQAAWKEVTS